MFSNQKILHKEAYRMGAAPDTGCPSVGTVSFAAYVGK